MEHTIYVIEQTILELDKPFQLAELIEILKQKGITNKRLILRVLNHLLDSGLVDYADFINETIRYQSRLIPVLN